MNQYGLMALQFSQRHRPQAMAHIEDPEKVFAAVGEEMAATIAETRDQIVGALGPRESDEDYQARQSQGWRTAEELVLTDHWTLVAETGTEDDPRDDLELAAYYRDLDGNKLDVFSYD